MCEYALQDGYPRTAQQALDLSDALDEQDESINLVVHLDVPDEVLIDRIENRWVHLPSGRIYNTTYNPPKTPGKDDVTGDDLIKRMDDRVDVFERRLSKFHQENNPIKQFYKARGTLVSLSGRTRYVEQLHKRSSGLSDAIYQYTARKSTLSWRK